MSLKDRITLAPGLNLLMPDHTELRADGPPLATCCKNCASAVTTLDIFALIGPLVSRARLHERIAVC